MLNVKMLVYFHGISLIRSKNIQVGTPTRRILGGADPSHSIRDDWQPPLCGMPDSCND
jgi:hypothetical protein